MKRTTLALLVGLLSFSCPSFGNQRSQVNAPNLSFDAPTTIALKPGMPQSFKLPMKEGEFALLSSTSSPKAFFSVRIVTPGGVEIPGIDDSPADSVGFVAQESGNYRVTFSMDKTDAPSAARRITVQVRHKPELPAGNAKTVRRLINGYEVEIRTWKDDSILTVERVGHLKYFLRGGGGNIAGFHFMDEPSPAEDNPVSKSVALVKSTTDKTGDGAPDVAISYYSGGAHCCFASYFIELGDKLKLAAKVDGDSVPIDAIGRAPGGGLRLKTGDNIFAYWLVSFADSPLPTIILDFQHGNLRPALDAMKKPAPSLAKLQSDARIARSKIDTKPYTSESYHAFDEAFWGPMLDLIYSGHENLAWQYFDMVWPPRKPGKNVFRADFERQLSKSWFWREVKKNGGRVALQMR